VPQKKGGRKKPTSGYCKFPKSLYFTVLKKFVNCKFFLEKFRQKKKKKKEKEKKRAVVAVGDIARETFPATFWF
jgi:hypothetical protein